MTARFFIRLAVTGALLATAVPQLGVISATAQNRGADRLAARKAPVEVVGTRATEVRRVPWMKEVQGDCSVSSVACTFDIVRAPPGARIEVRNTYCIIGVDGDSQMQEVALTRGGQSSPAAHLAPTKTSVDRFSNSTFVVTQKSFYFADPGDRIGIHAVAEGADIRFAICTLAGERVVLR